MYTIIVTHQVRDYETWKAGFLADEARRVALGVTGHTAGQIADQPGTAVAILHAKDIDGFQQAMQNPGLMEAMKEAGVLAPPTVVVLAGAQSKTY